MCIKAMANSDIFKKDKKYLHLVSIVNLTYFPEIIEF